MQKFHALLDERYQAVAVESTRMAPMRFAIAVALTVIVGLRVGWPIAGAWAGALFVSEGVGLYFGRGIGKEPVPTAVLERLFWVTLPSVPVWSAYGLILWTGPSQACAVGAAAYWCGQLLYAQNFCTKSPVAALQAGLPSVAAPLLLPLLIPRFHGVDQILVEALLVLGALQALASAVDNVNTARALALATRDLVAGKQAAEDARQEMAAAKAEADAANQAKSAFLATMSHEIRTPLNGVLGMTQAMAMDTLSEPQRERLDVVRESGEALLAILNDVLDLSKIEAGKLTLETIDFDLEQVVHGAYQAFTALANKKGLSFRLDIDDARGVYRGDPTRVRQILYNLISNALKFTEAGEIAVRAEAPNGRLRLVVTDTGEGIAPDKLPTLFSKFTQADTSTTRRFGGTGLGLAICHQLADLMGGSISAASVLGRGSTFSVTLDCPRVGAAQATPTLPSPDSPPEWTSKVRVLAAEDNRVNQLVLKTLLHHAGVDPVIVDNGALAVEAWESEPWDLILMDVSMPIMDGPTAVRMIRQRELATGRARTPIIALTANTMSHQVAEYIAGGMDSHIAKPIEAAKLFEALEAVLEKPAGEEVRAQDLRAG